MEFSKEKISGLEDIAIETIQDEIQREKRLTNHPHYPKFTTKKDRNSITGLKAILTSIMQMKSDSEKKKGTQKQWSKLFQF